jgi:hypothetical protein
MKHDNMRPHTTVNPLSTGDLSVRIAASMAMAIRNEPTDFPNRYFEKNEDGWQIVGKWMAQKPSTFSAKNLCFSHSYRNTIKRDPISLRPQVNYFEGYTWRWAPILTNINERTAHSECSSNSETILSIEPYHAISTYGQNMVKTCQNPPIVWYGS